MKAVWSSVIAGTLVLPQVGNAVGLGPIKVQSSLNQPFNAEIQLMALRNLPLNGIKARLAKDEEFKRAHIPRPYFLDELNFSIGKNKLGVPVIKISSQERINEPYIRFLLDVAWSDGQFYREYTVLLDPPSVNNRRHHPRKSYKAFRSGKTRKITPPATKKSQHDHIVTAEKVSPTKTKVKAKAKRKAKTTAKHAIAKKAVKHQQQQHHAKHAHATHHVAKKKSVTPVSASSPKKTVVKAKSHSHATASHKSKVATKHQNRTTHQTKHHVQAAEKSHTTPTIKKVHSTVTAAPVSAKNLRRWVDLTDQPTSTTDDLFQIAIKYRPFARVSIEQTMLAILGMNPEAFHHHNINGLKAGYRLHIPKVELIETVDKMGAIAEIKRQNNVWHHKQTIKPRLPAPYFNVAALQTRVVQPVVKELPKAKPAVDKREKSSFSAQHLIAELLLAPPSDVERNPLLTLAKPKANQESSQREQRLMTELTVAAEAVNTIKKSNADLQHKVTHLQKQNQQLSKKLNVDEKKLAQLNQQLARRVAPQTRSRDVEEAGSGFTFNRNIIIVLLLLLSGSGGAYYWFKRRLQTQTEEWFEDDDEIDTHVENTDDVEHDIVEENIATAESESVAAPDVEYVDPEPQEDAIVSAQDDSRADDFSIESISGEDAVASKLDLATAYINMQDFESARMLLDDVVTEGTDEQRREAERLLKQCK